MSYMQVVSYAQSGHAASQLYGYYGLFTIGFLTAALGGACMAYPAVENRERLTGFFKPLILVLALWVLLDLTEDRLDFWYRSVFLTTAPSDRVWFRQNRPFYWLDSNWLFALAALGGACGYDLVNRWKDWRDTAQGRWTEIATLVVLPVAGALAGLLAQLLLKHTGALDPLLSFFVQPQGDPTAPIVDNSGNLLKFDPPLTVRDFPHNWPQLFFDLGPHLGWIFGGLLGIGACFWRYGKWRSGSSLILYMGLGWFIAFVGMPVLLSPFFAGVGGFRMTPPGGDNWAGALGIWVAAMLWMRRHGLGAVNFTSIVCGLLGGLGFMTTQFIKVVFCAPGNRAVTNDPDVLQRWQHWQSANWHSLIMEQGAGLLFGLGAVVALGLLSTRTPPVANDPPVRRWPDAFSVFFLLNVLLYFNLVKIVADLTTDHGGYRAVPTEMKLPLVESVTFSAETWFTIVFLLFTLCTVALLAIHLRRPLLLVPADWSGKGMWVYLIFLWSITLGNLIKVLPGFSEQRLGTEATIFVNSLIVTFLLLTFGRGPQPLPVRLPRMGERPWRRMLPAFVSTCLVVALVGGLAYTSIARYVYHGTAVGGNSPMNNMRFGEKTDWYIKPILKRAPHR
jgi:hypothetical protein